MPSLHSTMVPLGTVAHDFELHGTEGKTYSLNSFVDKEIIVIIFMIIILFILSPTSSGGFQEFH